MLSFSKEKKVTKANYIDKKGFVFYCTKNKTWVDGDTGVVLMYCGSEMLTCDKYKENYFKYNKKRKK